MVDISLTKLWVQYYPLLELLEIHTFRYGNTRFNASFTTFSGDEIVGMLI